MSATMIFAGPSGVGKTAAALAIAADLECDPDWGGISEIASGMQNGQAVDNLLRSLRLRPLAGSGWKVAIVNEADRMTVQAEAVWLDGLEHLPAKTVVIFTTNNLGKLSQRFVRRCEVYHFDGSSAAFRAAMEKLVRQVWKNETGKVIGALPEGLGQFEGCDSVYSIGLALQQITPYARMGDGLPKCFSVPMIRNSGNQPAEPAPENGSGDAGPTVARYRVRCQICGEWIERKQAARHHSRKTKWRWRHARCR
jgi:hypothetical protein